MHTFKVVIVEPTRPGGQISAQIHRSDGRIVRHSMWPDAAEIDCALLNEYVKNNWTAEKYHAERKARFAALNK